MSLLTCRSSYLFTGCRQTLLISLFRPCSVSSSNTKNPTRIDKTKFRLVYNYPFIKIPVTFARIVITLPVFTVCSLPVVYIISEKQHLLYMLLATSLVQSGLFYLFSFLTRNMVGKIYVNKEGPLEDVLISSMSRFGRRVNTIYKAEEIIFSDYLNRLDNYLGFISIGHEKTKNNYKVSIKNAQFIDPLVCDYLFGKIHNIDIVKETQLKAIEAKKSTETSSK